MRTLLLFSLLTAVVQVKTQPVIDRSNYFDIGDSALLYFKYDTSLWSVDPGMAGANVTWDLSAVTIEHPSVIVDTMLFIDPIGTPFYPTNLSADYSDANICMLRKTDEFSTENNDYNYYLADEDSLAFLGHWAANGGTELWEDQYPDPFRELVFPLTFGDTYTDQFTRYYVDQSGSGEHFSEGTFTVTVDGYGTLITPDGVELDDAIRLYTIKTVTDSSMFGIQTSTLHNYIWYSESVKGFVVSMQMSIGEITQVETLHYQKQIDLATAIQSRPIEEQLILVEEGTELILMLRDRSAIEAIVIFDPASKLVNTINRNSDRILIERSGLPSGVYLINIVTSDRRKINGKFLVR